MLSGAKYVLAAFMMYAGIATMFLPPQTGSNLGFIYENRWVIASFGVLFFISGLTLFIGKIMKRRRVIGHGLFMVYVCFLFSFILNWVGLSFYAASGNLIGSFIVGALYLRWKYYIYYYQPCPHEIRGKMMDSEPDII